MANNKTEASADDLAKHFARIAAFEAARDNWKASLSKGDVAFLENLHEVDTKISKKNDVNYSSFTRK